MLMLALVNDTDKFRLSPVGFTCFRELESSKASAQSLFGFFIVGDARKNLAVFIPGQIREPDGLLTPTIWPKKRALIRNGLRGVGENQSAGTFTSIYKIVGRADGRRYKIDFRFILSNFANGTTSTPPEAKLSWDDGAQRITAVCKYDTAITAYYRDWK